MAVEIIVWVYADMPDQLQVAAGKIMPVLKTARNHNVSSFDKAYIVETTVTELQ